MSTPVVTDKWAGNFDCDFCGRKRLVGEEFSKKALEKYRKAVGKLKCKQCVQQQEEKERQAAAAKRAAAAATATDKDANASTTIQCKSCQKELDATHYNKNQWNKGVGKARCRICVEQSIQEEKQQQTNTQQAKLQTAKEKVAQAQASGNAQAILRAESELAALEAEKVTGLKPVKMSSSRGGGGRGRGRSGRGRVPSARGGRGRGRR